MSLFQKTIKEGPTRLAVAFDKAVETAPVEILIYDDIGKDPWTGEGITAKDIHAALAEIPKGRDLTFRINSRGGDVNEGKAIRAQLEDWPGKIVNKIDGVAASTASWMIPADETHARAASQLFIHKSWAMVVGNADDLTKAVKMLETTDGQIAEIYAKQTGRPADEMLKLMADETLLTAREAKDLGFINELVDEPALHNFSGNELLSMKTKLAALNTLKGVGLTPPTNQNQTQTKMETTTKPAEPTNSAPAAIDLSPVIAAINALGEKLKAPAQPVMPPGTDPLTARVENLGNPLIEKYNTLKAGPERLRFLRNHFDDLRGQMISFNPKNTNTIQSALTTAMLSSAWVTVAQTKLAMLDLFTRDFGTDPLKPKNIVQIRKVTAASTGQQNPTDFESGNSTMSNIAVTVNQESQSFHMSNADVLTGHRLEHIAEINARAFALQISKLVTAVMTTGNYGTAITVGAAANFDAEGLSPILAAAKNYNQKNLILDGGHLAYITPKTTEQLAWNVNGAFGFDRIAEQNDWTGAATNACGFVCGTDAIAVASGMAPDLPAAEFLSMENSTLANGLTVRTATWFSRGTRFFWAAHDVMFGVAAGDTTQAEVLITA